MTTKFWAIIIDRILLFVVTFLCAFNLSAKEYRFGFAFGLGGAGMKTTGSEKLGVKAAEKSEEPGVFSIMVERLYNDSWAFGIDHSRGFRLGPFSSGLYFTGFNAKWYFYAPAPNLSKNDPNGTHLFVQNFSPFVGMGSGIAQGTIQRQNDQIPEISSSGVYLGIRAGVDFLIDPTYMIRPEFVYSSTFQSKEDPKISISLVSLIQCNFIFSF